jgi:hypothetical protein
MTHLSATMSRKGEGGGSRNHSIARRRRAEQSTGGEGAQEGRGQEQLYKQAGRQNWHIPAVLEFDACYDENVQSRVAGPLRLS